MTAIDRLFPRWASSWAALARSNAHVRSQCRLCGLQQRVDSGAQALRFGGGASPVDQLDMCSVVGCHGRVYFLAARSYGRQWLTLLSRSEERRVGERVCLYVSISVVAVSLKKQNTIYNDPIRCNA